jgi:hypothetical protein
MELAVVLLQPWAPTPARRSRWQDHHRCRTRGSSFQPSHSSSTETVRSIDHAAGVPTQSNRSPSGFHRRIVGSFESEPPAAEARSDPSGGHATSVTASPFPGSTVEKLNSVGYGPGRTRSGWRDRSRWTGLERTEGVGAEAGPKYTWPQVGGPPLPAERPRIAGRSPKPARSTHPCATTRRRTSRSSLITRRASRRGRERTCRCREAV